MTSRHTLPHLTEGRWRCADGRALVSSAQRHPFMKERLVFLWTFILLSSPASSASQHNSRPHRRSSNSQLNLTTEHAITILSKVFDLDRVPQQQHHRSPPEYMLDFYNQVAYDDGISKAPGPYQADVVRGYPDRATQHRMHFKFNISYLRADEEILEAEFHLFKMHPGAAFSGRRRRAMSPHFIDLRLYQVLDEDRMLDSDGLKLVEQRRMSAHQHGWLIFRVGNVIREWMNDSNANLGFVLTSTTGDGLAVNGTLVRFAQRYEHHDSKQPGLVVFTENRRARVPVDDMENDFGGIESMRESFIQHLNEDYRAKNGPSRYQSLHKYMSPQLHRHLLATTRSRSKRSRRSSQHYNRYSKRRKKTCQQDKLYVDFDAIGWSGWIISPPGYDAYHCKGSCSFPLVQNLKPTNHATVQSIVHALRIKDNVDTPCCVPNELYSISLLYFDDEENVILKQYENMVAATCGCH